MTVLREGWNAAANEVLVRAMEQSHLFEETAAHLDATHPEAAALCRDLAGRRRALATDIAAALKARGEWPKVVDPERELADRLFDSVRSALSQDEAESLLDSRLHVDEHLRGAVQQACAADKMPEDIGRLLSDFAAQLEEDDQRIAAYLKKHRKGDAG